MNFLKRDYVCPFCFNRNDLYKVEFRCTNDPERCPLVIDQILSDFLGTPKMMPQVVKIPPPENKIDKIKSLKMPREAVCPVCKEKTLKRICPDCHSELPYTVGDFEDLIFSVIGARNAGKSHYISMLLSKIKNEIGAGFGCNLQALNDATIKRYREDFYDPIFRKREVIKSTRSARTDFNVRFPLIYTISFICKGLFKKNKIRDVATMVFFDTAGEDLHEEDTMRTENKYIYNSSGIILLLDPLQIPAVRSRLPSDINVPEVLSEAEDVLERTVNLIRNATNLRLPKLIDIPIAIAFSKIDALYPILDPSTCLKYPSKHINHFDIADFEDVCSEMESLIKEWCGDMLINTIKHNFSNYAFFGLSSLGCNPHGGEKIDKLRPHRVEDPFLWLLWKHKLIKDLRFRNKVIDFSKKIQSKWMAVIKKRIRK